jgi:hypothetical protein
MLAGARGTHTVYVWVIHQNITFMVQGAHLTADFNAKKKLEKMVCSTESEARALTQYANSSGSDAVCKLFPTMDNFEFGD